MPAATRLRPNPFIAEEGTPPMTKSLYIGTKVILAKPMNRQEYNDYRGWQLPDDEDGTDAGYLIEYTDGGRANHPDHKGYISWSPADVFNRAYRPANGLTFGQALDALKAGNRVAREGWNGKAMFLSLVTGSQDDGIDRDQAKVERNGINPCLFNTGDTGTVTRLPHIAMKTASGATLNGWLASQTDMLAEDWIIVAAE